MCFSAEADLVVGAAVTVVGVDALRQVRARREVPLAALPAVLGAHLLVEVQVWRSLEGEASAATGERAQAVYAVIAYGLVPVLAAVAITLWEPPDARRRMVPFVVLAVGAAGALMWWQITEPVVARIDGHHIEYVLRVGPAGGVAAVAYVVATCGPALLSHDGMVRRFGGANLVAVAVLALVEREGLVSLWCAWAAVTSVAIAARLRGGRPMPPGPEPGRAAPGHGGQPSVAKHSWFKVSSSSRRSLPSSSSVAAR